MGLALIKPPRQPRRSSAGDDQTARRCFAGMGYRRRKNARRPPGRSPCSPVSKGAGGWWRGRWSSSKRARGRAGDGEFVGDGDRSPKRGTATWRRCSEGGCGGPGARRRRWSGGGCGGSSAAVELAGEGAGGIEIEMEGESRSRWRGSRSSVLMNSKSAHEI